MLRLITVLLGVLLWPSLASATIYFEWDFEAETCNSVITNNSNHGSPTSRLVEWGGSNFGSYTGNQRPFVRCSVSTPSGTNYYEVQPIALQNSDAISITWPSDLALTNGAVYYVGWFHRIDRQGNGNPYTSVDSYDKCLDWGMQDSAGQTRWIISCGYPNGVYNSGAYVSTAYSYDLWCPADPGGAFGCHASQVFDSLPANVSPYSTSAIRQNAFEAWHAVYFEVKMGTGTSGYIKLFVDGVNTHSYLNIQTAGSTSPHFNRFWVNSTLSQPTENTTARAIQVDHILFTDNFADVQAAGLDRDPNTGSTPAQQRWSPGVNLRVAEVE